MIESVEDAKHQLSHLDEYNEPIFTQAIDELETRIADLERRQRPTVVCLCGSTRFSDAFRKANLEETLAGRIVLSIGCDFKSDDALGLTADDKVRLDELHLRKIDLADEILVLNVDGYIGESTQREIAYANKQGKCVRLLVDYWL